MTAKGFKKAAKTAKKTIKKGNNIMPAGSGTYGSKVGRPSKKAKSAGKKKPAVKKVMKKRNK